MLRMADKDDAREVKTSLHDQLVPMLEADTPTTPLILALAARHDAFSTNTDDKLRLMREIRKLLNTTVAHRDEWSDGWEAGWEAGYRAGRADLTFDMEEEEE